MSFSKQEVVQPETDIYIIFDGTEQRHVTKAVAINDQTIQAVIPGKFVSFAFLLLLQITNACLCICTFVIR